MLTKEKIPWSFIKFSQLILKGNAWRSVWRICMWILGLKGLRIPANSYILGSLLRRGICVVGRLWRMEKEPSSHRPPCAFLSIIAIFPVIRKPSRRREHLRHESFTYRLKTFDFFELTLSNKLAFWLKFQLFDGMVCSWCARRKVCELWLVNFSHITQVYQY